MKIDDLDIFDMEPLPFDGCDILCPACNEWSSHTEWTEYDIPCEDCGDHYAMKCPKCEEVQSSVSYDILKVREPLPKRDEMKLLITAIDEVHLPISKQLRTMITERHNNAHTPTPPDPIMGD